MTVDAQRLFRRSRDGGQLIRFRVAAMLVVATVAALGLPAVALGFAAPATFGSTGAEQSYTVPSGVMVEGVLVQGAYGGSSDAQPGNTLDQSGATLQGYLQTAPGQTLYTEVGQNGTAGGGAAFGGGGAAGSGGTGNVCNGYPCGGAVAGSGGGASDVRTCSMSATSCPGGGSSLDSRLIVAAGAGGDAGDAAGGGCQTTWDMGGKGENDQLPSPSPQGPPAITTAAGTVIPGFAGGNLASVMTVNGTTNAGMGTTAAGAGGSQTGCTVNNFTYSNFAAGNGGSGPDGGSGGNSSASTGAGGGGGGGYFGGGGGASGSSTCSPSPCSPTNTGEGGGAGSSFASNAIEYPTFTFATAEGDVFIEYWPVIEIDTPANGAVYSPGQVVDASWGCASYSSGPGGCNSSSGTVPSGSPIDTTPGTHTFTVNGKVNVTGNGSQPVSATITYTVKPSGGPGGPGGTGGPGAGKPPAAKNVRAVISSKHHSARFTFSAAGATGFQCALTHKPKGNHKMAKPNYSSCTSPKTYKHLKVGRYTFFVRAVSHGLVGTAASKSFKIG
jgi:hypothetical protein